MRSPCYERSWLRDHLSVMELLRIGACPSGGHTIPLARGDACPCLTDSTQRYFARKGMRGVLHSESHPLVLSRDTRLRL
jgi:hypothetical protein